MTEAVDRRTDSAAMQEPSTPRVPTQPTTSELLPYVPTRAERLEEMRRFVGPALALGIVAVFGAWLAWRFYHPTKSAIRAQENPPGATPRLTATPTRPWERAYAGALKRPDEWQETERMLSRVAVSQRHLAAVSPEDQTLVGELQRIEAARDVLRAKLAARKSFELEASAAAASPDTQAALLREAADQQRVANTGVDADTPVDFPREQRLRRRAADMEAGPLHATLMENLRRADAAAERGEWDPALASYRTARRALQRLEEKFPESSYIDHKLADDLSRKIATAESLPTKQSYDTTRADADAAFATGKLTAAALGYTRAAALQKQINEQYPLSRHASAAALDELDVLRQTASSAEELRAIKTVVEQIRQRLRAGNVDEAATMAAEVAARYEKLLAGHRRSAELDAELRFELEYIAAKRGQLREIQSSVSVQPLPDSTGVQMMTTEVSQKLYEVVMNANPSLHRGPQYPVECVTWQNAIEFCRRLSCVLGAKARLPTEDEFRRVAAAEAAGTWLAPAANQHTHAVGTSATRRGFYDIAGNVAEWLDTPNLFNAAVAGGSFRDPSLPELGLALRAKNSRAPEVGFRVVIEN